MKVFIPLAIAATLAAQTPIKPTKVKPVESKELSKPTAKSVDLPPAAREAVQESRIQSESTPAPNTGKDGAVTYIYGAGIPTVPCALVRLCVIQLQPGEHLTGPPLLGDDVRWSTAPLTMGSGESATPLIVVKPLAAGIDTNLLIATDRRAYYIRLVGDSEKYVARTAFTYPDDQQREWAQALAKQNSQQQIQQQRNEEFQAAQIAPLETLEHANMAYDITGDKELRPVLVLDDGKKTFIRMPAGVSARELPTLLIYGQNGEEMVNFRVKGDTYIVDRLGDRFVLMLGTGKHARKVEIRKHQEAQS